MKKLRPVWSDDGKHKAGSVIVSVCEFTSYGTFAVISPSEIGGTGSNYGAALEDFINQFDEYIAELQYFRDEILTTKRAFIEAVEVDWSGKPVIKG